MFAQLLAFATDEISLRVGQTLAGLLNATLVSDSPVASYPLRVDAS
jgi:Ca2+/H+ antiporter